MTVKSYDLIMTELEDAIFILDYETVEGQQTIKAQEEFAALCKTIILT